MTPRYVDTRPVLSIAEATWAREDAAGRAQMAEAAIEQGFRLVIVRPDGTSWSPRSDVRGWSDRAGPGGR